MLVYKYRGGDETIFERDLSSIKNNVFFAPKHDLLNDPCETLVCTDKFVTQARSLSFLFGTDKEKKILNVQDAVRNLFHVRKKTLGIYSLSKTYVDELLWAHYANSHKGFCIEYDLDKLLNCDKSFGLYAFDIEYSKEPPQYSMKDINNHRTEYIVKKIAGHKSIRWEYEKEYRIITDFFGNHSYDFEAVKGIYFGLNMSENQKEILMNTLEGRGIKFYQIKQIPKTYQFERELINDVFKEEISYFKKIPNIISRIGDVKIDILEKKYIRESKANITIEIESYIDEKSIKWLAKKIKEEMFKNAERVFIFFYLKGDSIKNLAWATAHFSPEFEIKILGAKKENIEDLDKVIVIGNILETWEDNFSVTPCKYFLVNENGKLFMKSFFAKNGLSDSYELIEEVMETDNKDSIRLDYENNYGEYYIVEKNGYLGIYGENGKFREAKKRDILKPLKNA
ncbi:DUF2971 domain-containing protein [Flavobacterium aquicola]|uniref:DUF2971 family protein n=1 Tax=Flavobacterium aquicola TaxID=1682742 RepID=A0A3E0EUM8_9FLAO|nr:DUF2971 domain-containing protein [Flavobacterium aquicola]REH01839.1 hypothetical protein C8P67_101323 [Flavobacterium aquicola]